MSRDKDSHRVCPTGSHSRRTDIARWGTHTPYPSEQPQLWLALPETGAGRADRGPVPLQDAGVSAG